MKRIQLFFLALVCFMGQSLICCADDKPIPVEQLPEAAKTFIKKHFPTQAISYAAKDAEISGATYEVRLNDGTEIDFDRKGNWDKVDCKLKAVPAAIVPAAIVSYVSAKFPDQQIVKIDKERGGHEIELTNDLELKFNKRGALIGMDD